MDILNTPVFTMADAKASGLSKDQVYRLISDGSLERAARGIYIRTSEVEPSFTPLAAATAVRPDATLCLTSALVYHRLIDAIPFGCDIALPRGTRFVNGIDYAIWHSFDPSTFTIGRTILSDQPGLTLFTYSPERCIVDTFRMAHQEGFDTAIQALKRWLAKQGSSPTTLLDLVKHFPKAEPSIRQTLKVLL